MVASTRCTGVVGASGSGKSSLARAGLLAALRDDALPGSAEWPRVLVTPGGDPMLELARGLALVCHASSPEHVRDRLLEDPQSLSALTARALEGTNGGVASRARRGSARGGVHRLQRRRSPCSVPRRARARRDRSRFADDGPRRDPCRLLRPVRGTPRLRRATRTGNVLVGSMRPDELQRAIEEPARCAGLVLEDGLVDRIFDDVGTEPGSLPLLETALLETWIRRSGHTLTLEGYEASGGVQRRGRAPRRRRVRAAVAARSRNSRATSSSGSPSPAWEPTTSGGGPRSTSSSSTTTTPKVLATLVEHRLVVTGDITAEVAHEALLREWPRLRGWLEEDREGRTCTARPVACRAGLGGRHARRRPPLPWLSPRRCARRRRRTSGRDQSPRARLPRREPRAPGRRAAGGAAHRAPLPALDRRARAVARRGTDRRRHCTRPTPERTRRGHANARAPARRGVALIARDPPRGADPSCRGELSPGPGGSGEPWCAAGERVLEQWPRANGQLRVRNHHCRRQRRRARAGRGERQWRRGSLRPRARSPAWAGSRLGARARRPWNPCC